MTLQSNSGSGNNSRGRSPSIVDTFRQNFGGYVLALIVVLLAYSAVDIVEPKYSNYFAIITLLGIVLFYKG